MKIGVPESYMEYKAKVQAGYRTHISQKPSMNTIENKLLNEIDRLKKKYDTKNLSGSSSEDMKKDYYDKKQKILDELLSATVKKGSSGEDIKDTSEYAKAIRDIENYEWGKYEHEEEKYRRKHVWIVEPSLQKVKLQPADVQDRYADAIYMQLNGEIRRKEKVFYKIENEKRKVKQLAKRLFYESLEYNPKIVQKELEELLED